jgi:hypothetical protein
VNCLRLLSLGCFVAAAAIGCSSNIKPTELSVQSPSVPTMESILQLLGVLQFDGIAIEVIDLERENLTKKLQGIGANRHFTPAQKHILDEFIGNALAVIDEEMSVDRVREIIAIMIQQSFSQQDIDAVTVFYRTRAGRSIVAQYPQAFRAYFKAKQAAREADRAPNDGGSRDAPLPPVIGAFFRPWENRDYANFFSSDVGQDIIARLPTANRKYDEATENIEQEVAIRERRLVSDFQAKMKAARAE